MNVRIWLAEFIGTFALVFAGIATLASGAGGLEVALAFGLSVAVMIGAVGALSFAPLHPAGGGGIFVKRRISFVGLVPDWSAEILGAISALLLLQFSVGGERLRSVSYGATTLASGITVMQGFTIEVVLTFFLMFVIATCVIQRQALAGVYIGGTVTLGALAGGALTGASMNPARSLAPALFGGIWSHHWLYWLAPIIGASIAALTASYLWRNSDDLEPSQSPPLQQASDESF